MPDITPEIVADELQHQLMPVPLAARPILLEAIANLISKQVQAERTRCRELCEQRAELWRNTKGGAPLASVTAPTVVLRRERPREKLRIENSGLRLTLPAAATRPRTFLLA